MPVQAKANNLQSEPVPEELSTQLRSSIYEDGSNACLKAKEYPR